jgi:hypothetical protein
MHKSFSFEIKQYNLESQNSEAMLIKKKESEKRKEENNHMISTRLSNFVSHDIIVCFTLMYYYCVRSRAFTVLNN